MDLEEQASMERVLWDLDYEWRKGSVEGQEGIALKERDVAKDKRAAGFHGATSTTINGDLLPNKQTKFAKASAVENNMLHDNSPRKEMYANADNYKNSMYADMRKELDKAMLGKYDEMYTSLKGEMQNLVLEPTSCSITVTVLHFKRCALCVQMIYYPFHGGTGNGELDDVDYGDEDTMRSRRTLKTDYGEPVILRCQPYLVPLTELLLPHKCSPVEFLRIWPSLPAVAEFIGTYVYEGSGFKATAAVESGTPPFFTGLRALKDKPFFQVCSHVLRTVAGFQVCYAAKTWHGDFLGMIIFGASEMSRNVDFGDETTTMMCKFVLRSSSSPVLDEITVDVQQWLDDLTDGALTYVTEEEVQTAADEKLKRSMEQMAIFKAAAAARPPPSPPKEDDESAASEEKPKEPKEPSTLTTYTAEEIEHRALQAAVLQEWEMFRAK
ncbi:hypothetical protein L7F22_012788 [Adiantum nelumboides]|nr:hypothetical protein [Adiantum nelumboides]